MKCIYLGPFILLTACKPACNNKNTVFDKNASDSRIYNAELAQQIKTQEVNMTHYRVENYEEKDGKEYMNVEMQATDMCAHVKLDITDNVKLNGFREVKGSGYSGAELEGPKLRIEEVNDNYVFYLEDVDKISD